MENPNSMPPVYKELNKVYYSKDLSLIKNVLCKNGYDASEEKIQEVITNHGQSLVRRVCGLSLAAKLLRAFRKV